MPIILTTKDSENIKELCSRVSKLNQGDMFPFILRRLIVSNFDNVSCSIPLKIRVTYILQLCYIISVLYSDSVCSKSKSISLERLKKIYRRLSMGTYNHEYILSQIFASSNLEEIKQDLIFILSFLDKIFKSNDI